MSLMSFSCHFFLIILLLPLHCLMPLFARQRSMRALSSRSRQHDAAAHAALRLLLSSAVTLMMLMFSPL